MLQNNEINLSSTEIKDILFMEIMRPLTWKFQNQGTPFKKWDPSVRISHLDIMFINFLLEDYSVSILGKLSSRKYHHAYKNGHFMHILEMMYNVNQFAKHLPGWTQFYIKLAVLFHDLEKIGLDKEFHFDTWISCSLSKFLSKLNTILSTEEMTSKEEGDVVNFKYKDNDVQFIYEQLLRRDSVSKFFQFKVLTMNVDFDVETRRLSIDHKVDQVRWPISYAVKWHHGIWINEYDSYYANKVNTTFNPDEMKIIDGKAQWGPMHDGPVTSDMVLVLNFVVLFDSMSAANMLLKPAHEDKMLIAEYTRFGHSEWISPYFNSLFKKFNKNGTIYNFLFGSSINSGMIAPSGPELRLPTDGSLTLFE